tara:strand:- start:228 stop:1358 length:1131 start_codon:yes stop_codon:yes gene_type:complete
MTKARDIADNAGQGGGGNKNLIINGAQNVHQRGNQTGLTGNSYGTDRFEFIIQGRDELVYNLAQNTDVPSGYGFANSLSFQATTAESAIAADEYAFISQKIEAQNLQHLAYGTSSAKKLTASFWVKSSVTGTFCLGLYKDDAAGSLTSQVHNKTYTISAANTWEHKTITFEANTLTGGGMDDDSGVGLYLTWHLAAGSDFDSGSSTSSGWANYTTTNWCEPSTTDAVITTTNATFLLTGVQLEVGDKATDFEHRSYGDEYQKCLRYYEQWDTVNGENVVIGTSYGGTNPHAVVDMKVIKRAAPAVTLPAAGTGTGQIAFLTGQGSTTSTIGTHSTDRLNARSIRIGSSGYGGLSSSQPSALYAYGGNSSFKFDAEL